MARPPRPNVADIPQHVIQRGHNKRRTFFDAEDRRRYLHWLGEGAQQVGCEIHAYVLMTNHVHLLLTPRRSKAISELIQFVGTRYGRYLNDRRERTGAVWQGRHKGHFVDSESYFWTVHRYIELNPVRAGMIGDPAEYRWSSYRRNALGKANGLVMEHSIYTGLAPDAGARLAAYRQLFETGLSDRELERIRNDLNKTTFWPS